MDLPPLHVGELGSSLLGIDVERIAPHVPHMAEHLLADGDGDPPTRVVHGRATGQAVGRLHADRPHAALAELLGDFGEHGYRLALDLDLELQRRVQRRQRAAGELDVDHRTGDPDDAALGARRLLVVRNGHSASPLNDAVCSSTSVTKSRATRAAESSLPPARASAPLTISMISVVIESWRARFMIRLNDLINSSALSVADFIAR